ncbi:hypothetical protein AGDE_12678 [Angomonas deanei]|uniref:Uncharacterized protein n=1 Tax=Angomonas deanei TaxID=59799 RepID=A0A7G2C5G2_9TRYP|nr:hypothetical protein AGDE_12678 [Angomonas deanei]CAD2214976.1 hypothetical protein, conserved [Angomonas deanei]|eukprot:EPY23863.1 hypothetical protein AGDE_12678 [Angomonas deanei]
MSEPNTLDEDATNDETFDADVEPEFLVPQLATLASEESVNEEEEEVALPDDVSDEVHVSSDHDDGMEEEEPGEVKNPKSVCPSLEHASRNS